MICSKCREKEANPALYLVGIGKVCHCCFGKGSDPKKKADAPKKIMIKRPEVRLSNF